MYVVHRASDARSYLLTVFKRADTVEPCCAIAEHGFVEVVCWLVFWNFNEFFKIFVVYHMNHFSVKIGVVAICFRRGVLSRRFFIAGQGGPEGTPFNFFALAKKFFTAGDPWGSRGFGGEKNLERENSGRKKSTKRSSDEKIVQNGRTVRSARGLGGAFQV